MPGLQIRLLGDFRIDDGGAPLTSITSARLQSLFAYLVLHRGAAQPRAHVAFQFWPDSSEAQAQANLRYFLHQLRRALPDPAQYLQADKTTLQWRAEAPYTLVAAENAAPAEQARASRRSRTTPATCFRPATTIGSSPSANACAHAACGMFVVA